MSCPTRKLHRGSETIYYGLGHPPNMHIKIGTPCRMNYSNDSKCGTRTTTGPRGNPTMLNGQRNNISKDRRPGTPFLTT